MKNRMLSLIRFSLIVFAVAVALAATETNAATYFISPSGSNSSSGISSASSWKSFAYAVPKLKAGDTLILRNGTYGTSNSGYPYIACGTNAANGTATQRITIKAENERQAWIKGNGATLPFNIYNCSYWTIEGLHISSADNNTAAADVGSIVSLNSVTDVIFRRNLLHNNNRYMNGSAISTPGYINNSLIEENEVYNFHRNGIAINGTGNVLRRNYINSRNMADISGGYVSGDTTGGDAGITLYPASNTTVENNISENNDSGFGIAAAYGIAANNKFLGNISINDSYAIRPSARKENTGVNQMPQNTTIENHVSLNPISIGVYLSGNKNTHMRNVTVKGHASIGAVVAAPSTVAPGDGKPTVYSQNVLVFNVIGSGFNMVDQYDWRHEYPNSYNNSKNYAVNHSASNDTRYQNKITIDPQLGNCIVFVPDSSPMKRAGKNGADIGANVLYRYQNGVLTSQPLWNTATGEFPHGAIVAGINDVPGKSASDVHRRLNVNTNGCALPEGYSMGSSPLVGSVPLSPLNLKVAP